MLILYEGLGRTTSKFPGSYNGNVQSPRVFRGVIRYDAVSLRSGSDPLSSLPISTRVACMANQRRVKIRIMTDQYGYETSWSFTKQGGTDPLFQGPDGGGYNSTTLLKGTICVDRGIYVFQIKDRFSDGLCCSAGDGYYKIFIENEDGSWRQVVEGSKFESSMEHVIDVHQDVHQNVGKTESTMTDRDKGYLVAHNKRRMDWHARYGKEYVPLKWSEGLKQSSLEYAEKLLETCETSTPKHATDNPYGENIARNKGVGGWGQLYDPDKIVGRFVDREEGLPWARNGHLTNALWRSTRYVGCAEANKSYQVVNKNGQTVTQNCRSQVCRYTKPGNCSMGKYKRKDGTYDWETPMLMDDTPCGPECPPEGCHD